MNNNIEIDTQSVIEPTESKNILAHDKHGIWPKAVSVNDFKKNLVAVQQRINNACVRVGRDPQSVRLLPVSKTMEEPYLRMAYEAGCRHFGENKTQEAWKKYQTMGDLKDLHWSVIGHLQTNKAKFVAKFASEFQALDSLKLAEALERRLQVEGRTLDVYVQVNTSQEESKYGLAESEVRAFLQQLTSFECLKVKGLMTLAEFSQDTERVRKCFIKLRNLRDRLSDEHFAQQTLGLSMGMSGDFEVAIEEGATVVRVGQAIFGARALPDEYFWPSKK